MIKTDPPVAFATVCIACVNLGENQATTRTVQTQGRRTVVLIWECGRCHATMTETLSAPDDAD